MVIAFTIDPNSAQAQMTFNQNVLGGIGPARKPIDGIGDEAFETVGSVMTIRKGDKLISITYSSCPCTVNAIKPLARKLTEAL